MRSALTTLPCHMTSSLMRLNPKLRLILMWVPIGKITKLYRAGLPFAHSHHNLKLGARADIVLTFTTSDLNCRVLNGFPSCITGRLRHHGLWTRTLVLSGLPHLLQMPCKQLPSRCINGSGNLTFPNPLGNWWIRRSSSTSNFEHLNERSSLRSCKLASVDGNLLPTRIPFCPTRHTMHIVSLCVTYPAGRNSMMFLQHAHCTSTSMPNAKCNKPSRLKMQTFTLHLLPKLPIPFMLKGCRAFGSKSKPFNPRTVPKGITNIGTLMKSYSDILSSLKQAYQRSSQRSNVNVPSGHRRNKKIVQNVSTFHSKSSQR